MKKIIESKIFNIFIVSAIIINWVSMWLETYDYIKANYWTLINIINYIIILIFVIEALMKIITYRIKYFKSWWNLFDFSIVIISLIPNLWSLNIIRTLRLLRLVSVIPEMRKIVLALVSVIPWIASVSGLLFILFYIYSIITTTLYWNSFPEWFWTIWNSFYTLFQIMTLESWSMWIVRPVMEVYPNSWLIFISFVIIATFIMVNLVIAIVVEAMNKITQKEEKHIIETIEENKAATKKDLKVIEKKLEEINKILINKNL